MLLAIVERSCNYPLAGSGPSAGRTDLFAGKINDPSVHNKVMSALCYAPLPIHLFYLLLYNAAPGILSSESPCQKSTQERNESFLALATDRFVDGREARADMGQFSRNVI